MCPKSEDEDYDDYGETYDDPEHGRDPDCAAVIVRVPMHQLQTETTPTGRLDGRRLREMVRSRILEVTGLGRDGYELSALSPPDSATGSGLNRFAYVDTRGDPCAVIYIAETDLTSITYNPAPNEHQQVEWLDMRLRTHVHV